MGAAVDRDLVFAIDNTINHHYHFGNDASFLFNTLSISTLKFQ